MKTLYSNCWLKTYRVHLALGAAIFEEYHCPRALWIAQQHGLDAIAFGAPDVSLKGWSLRANVREQLARSWCAVDLYVLHRGPKFLGPKEPILVGAHASAYADEL